MQPICTYAILPRPPTHRVLRPGSDVIVVELIADDAALHEVRYLGGQCVRDVSSWHGESRDLPFVWELYVSHGSTSLQGTDFTK